MLDESIKIERKQAQEFQPIPADMYQVELLSVDAVKKATYETRNAPEDQKKYENVLNFQFTLLEGELRAVRSVWMNFVPTFLYISSKKGKNKLYKIIEALIGRELSPEEEATLDAKDLNALIGKQCRVLIENKTVGEKTYSNIANLVPAKSTLPPLTGEEKQKATVKKAPPEVPATIVEGHPDHVTVDEIPF